MVFAQGREGWSQCDNQCIGGLLLLQLAMHFNTLICIDNLLLMLLYNVYCRYNLIFILC